MQRQGNNNPASARLDDLLVVMEHIEGLYHGLRDVLADKLGHMRRSDVAGMAACVERENELVGGIIEQEGLRKQVMEQVGRGYGMSSKTARTMPARRLAERVTEPHRSRLTQVADRLKGAVAEVKRVNSLITRVSAEVLTHLGSVFAAVSGTDAPAGGYTSAGRTVDHRPRELFETIG